nr:hypothetical protein CFP56_48986 [Quercus suber]
MPFASSSGVVSSFACPNLHHTTYRSSPPQSSPELCVELGNKLEPPELQCVVWWRLGQAKDGTTPEEEAEGTTRTLSSSKSFCSGDPCGGGGGSA